MQFLAEVHIQVKMENIFSFSIHFQPIITFPELAPVSLKIPQYIQVPRLRRKAFTFNQQCSTDIVCWLQRVSNMWNADTIVQRCISQGGKLVLILHSLSTTIAFHGTSMSQECEMLILRCIGYIGQGGIHVLVQHSLSINSQQNILHRFVDHLKAHLALHALPTPEGEG